MTEAVPGARARHHRSPLQERRKNEVGFGIKTSRQFRPTGALGERTTTRRCGWR